MRTGNLGRDRITQALASLPPLEPDPTRVLRTRTRCHAALRRRSWRERLAGLAESTNWHRALEPAAAGLIGAVYLAEVARRAWQLYGF